MRHSSFDPTAGDRARALATDPGSQPIVDPTDPRYAELVTARTTAPEQIVDPTDSKCGQPVT